MEMLIMRHGAAQPMAASDLERPLTAAGEAEVLAVARFLAGQAFDRPVICHSPFVRARQSAAIVQQWIGGESGEYVELTPDADPGAAVAVVQAKDATLLLCVAHQPLVGCMLNYLVDGDSGWGRPFATGAVALLHCEFPGPAGGSLRWYREPGEL